MNLTEITNSTVFANPTPTAKATADSIPADTIAKPGIPPELSSLKGIFTFVINLILGVGIAVTIIFLILGGIQYITARGDSKAAGAARDALTNAVIGFVVVIGAFTIKTIVAGAIGATSTDGVKGVITF